MNPFFCRIGSKKTIKNIILNKIPEHEIYVEAFIGGGAIYFAKEPSEIEVINDLDKFLIEGYRVLKRINKNNISRAFQLAESIDSIKNKKNKILIANQILDMKEKDDGLKLYQVIMKLCATYASKGFGPIYKPKSFLHKLNKIDEYKERLKKTKIFSTDYKNIIKKYDSKDTFFFLDPPYEKSKTLYIDSQIDYEEMRDILLNIKGKFLLTINSSPEIKNIFNDFNIEEIKVKGLGQHEGTVGQDRYELLITNY